MLFTVNKNDELKSQMRATVLSSFKKTDTAKKTGSYKEKMNMDGRFKSISGRDYIYYKKLLLTQRNMR